MGCSTRPARSQRGVSLAPAGLGVGPLGNSPKTEGRRGVTALCRGCDAAPPRMSGESLPLLSPRRLVDDVHWRCPAMIHAGDGADEAFVRNACQLSCTRKQQSRLESAVEFAGLPVRSGFGRSQGNPAVKRCQRGNRYRNIKAGRFRRPAGMSVRRRSGCVKQFARPGGERAPRFPLEGGPDLFEQVHRARTIVLDRLDG